MSKLTRFFLILFLISTVFVSCKKEHACVCGDGNGNYDTIIIKDTGKKATAKCREIEDGNSQYNECVLDY